MKSAIELIAAERERQVTAEGYSPAHDDEYEMDQLANAASCYALPRGSRYPVSGGVPVRWPWEAHRWKPTPEDRERELVKAGALIAAELDRRQRRKVLDSQNAQGDQPTD